MSSEGKGKLVQPLGKMSRRIYDSSTELYDPAFLLLAFTKRREDEYLIKHRTYQ